MRTISRDKTTNTSQIIRIIDQILIPGKTLYSRRQCPSVVKRIISVIPGETDILHIGFGGNIQILIGCPTARESHLCSTKIYLAFVRSYGCHRLIGNLSSSHQKTQRTVSTAVTGNSELVQSKSGNCIALFVNMMKSVRFIISDPVITTLYQVIVAAGNMINSIPDLDHIIIDTIRFAVGSIHTFQFCFGEIIGNNGCSSTTRVIDGQIPEVPHSISAAGNSCDTIQNCHRSCQIDYRIIFQYSIVIERFTVIQPHGGSHKTAAGNGKVTAKVGHCGTTTVSCGTRSGIDDVEIAQRHLLKVDDPFIVHPGTAECCADISRDIHILIHILASSRINNNRTTHGKVGIKSRSIVRKPLTVDNDRGMSGIGKFRIEVFDLHRAGSIVETVRSPLLQRRQTGIEYDPGRFMESVRIPGRSRYCTEMDAAPIVLNSKPSHRVSIGFGKVPGHINRGTLILQNSVLLRLWNDLIEFIFENDIIQINQPLTGGNDLAFHGVDPHQRNRTVVQLHIPGNPDGGILRIRCITVVITDVVPDRHSTLGNHSLASAHKSDRHFVLLGFYREHSSRILIHHRNGRLIRISISGLILSFNSSSNGKISGRACGKIPGPGVHQAIDLPGITVTIRADPGIVHSNSPAVIDGSQAVLLKRRSNFKNKSGTVGNKSGTAGRKIHIPAVLQKYSIASCIGSHGNSAIFARIQSVEIPESKSSGILESVHHQIRSMFQIVPGSKQKHLAADRGSSTVYNSGIISHSIDTSAHGFCQEGQLGRIVDRHLSVVLNNIQFPCGGKSGIRCNKCIVKNQSIISTISTIVFNGGNRNSRILTADNQISGQIHCAIIGKGGELISHLQITIDPVCFSQKSGLHSEVHIIPNSQTATIFNRKVHIGAGKAVVVCIRSTFKSQGTTNCDRMGFMPGINGHFFNSGSILHKVGIIHRIRVRMGCALKFKDCISVGSSLKPGFHGGPVAFRIQNNSIIGSTPENPENTAPVHTIITMIGPRAVGHHQIDYAAISVFIQSRSILDITVKQLSLKTGPIVRQIKGKRTEFQYGIGRNKGIAGRTGIE